MSSDHPSPLDALLRKPGGGIARSAYEVERNPWSRKGDVEAALLFRGTIVSAYGYIETQLGELAIRCSRIDAYASLRSNFPYSVDRRVAFLRNVFSQGPLAPCGRHANLFLDRLERASELRHMAAHARMQVLPDWGVTFDDIPKAGSDTITIRSRRLTMVALERSAWESARLSRLCQHLLGRLDHLGILPEK